MPAQGAIQLLSPAELSYLHSSLALSPPIRPDGRTTTQFRPLVAETDILPGTNGSARICFADGTEAVVGVKAEVERSAERRVNIDNDGANGSNKETKGENAWVELSIEIPGFRDDDALPVFLSAMLNEGLLASGELPRRLRINSRFHWKLYIDILLLSPPLSYPLPLLSLTTHLALLHARLPRLKSELDEDPLFDDDWAQSVPLYDPKTSSTSSDTATTASAPANTPIPSRPPITLLVMAVGKNILFDPSREELAVAEVVLAVSLGEVSSSSSSSGPLDSPDKSSVPSRNTHLLSVRTIDPPSRLTPPGVPNELNPATGGVAPAGPADAIAAREALVDRAGGAGAGAGAGGNNVWTPPRGGVKRGVIQRMIGEVTRPGGVADEVLDALSGVGV